MAKGITNSCAGGGASGALHTAPCTDIIIKRGNGQVLLTWTDPVASETIYGQTITWKNTSVRYKANTPPTSANDGILAVTETTRNQYQSTPLVIDGLTNGVTYYVSVFPKSEAGGVNTDASQIVNATPKDTSIWTVQIDQSNSNPETCCTYADDAVGMTKGSAEWDEIFGYKPCVMKDGVIQGYLNPNDFTKYENGTTAPITNSAYDVMIEFPRMGLNISTSGNIISVSLTDDTSSDAFQYLAHKRGNTQKDYFYLGAYSATGSSIRLTSVSGASPLANVSITNFINYAHNRTTGYEIMGFYQFTFIQALYILKYSNLNSQSALGQGCVSGSAAQTTGATNTKGMCYGNPNSSTDRMKLFGLEDFWGNIYQFICGLYCNSSYNLLTTTDNFGVNTSTSAWEYSVASGGSNSGWITKTQGTNNGGFVIKAASGGSSTTYFSDYSYLGAGRFPYVGGSWGAGAFAGVFYCRVYSSTSDASSDIGSRLMFL